MEDFSATKPELHRIYVKFAISGLTAIDRAAALIAAESKTSIMGCLMALQTEREKLIQEDAAYAEADELLKIARRFENEQH